MARRNALQLGELTPDGLTGEVIPEVFCLAKRSCRSRSGTTWTISGSSNSNQSTSSVDIPRVIKEFSLKCRKNSTLENSICFFWKFHILRYKTYLNQILVQYAILFPILRYRYHTEYVIYFKNGGKSCFEIS